MQRWVGLGVIADNVIQIGRCLALQRLRSHRKGDANGVLVEIEHPGRLSRSRIEDE
jgi:hypothetical protein